METPFEESTTDISINQTKHHSFLPFFSSSSLRGISDASPLSQCLISLTLAGMRANFLASPHSSGRAVILYLEIGRRYFPWNFLPLNPSIPAAVALISRWLSPTTIAFRAPTGESTALRVWCLTRLWLVGLQWRVCRVQVLLRLLVSYFKLGTTRKEPNLWLT